MIFSRKIYLYWFITHLNTTFPSNLALVSLPLFPWVNPQYIGTKELTNGQLQGICSVDQC